jgi:hypothetical protein
MNRKKLVLGIGVIAAVLALSMSAFALFRIAVTPANAIVSIAGQNTVDFDGFCNSTPCNITWTAVLSNANVGSISTTSGPTTTFTAGTSTGTAYIFASDGNGHMAQAKVDVQP